MQSTASWRGAPGAKPTTRRPLVTYALLLAVITVMSVEVLLASQGNNLVGFVKTYGLRADSVGWANPMTYISLVTFNFLHSGASHFAVNAVIMLFAGAAVEKHAGWRATLFIWIVGGIVSGIAHLFFVPNSTGALIGASGAISATLGAAFVIGWRWALPVRFWPGRRALFSIPLPLITSIWLAFQINSFVRVAMTSPENSTVAYWVHLAGFGFGALCAIALHFLRRIPPQYTASAGMAGD